MAGRAQYAMDNVVLKVKYAGESYRLMLHDLPTYDSVAIAIMDAWPEFATVEPLADGPAVAVGILRGQAKYLDEDGDLCTLTPHTFTDFLMLHGGELPGNRRILKLVLQCEAPAPMTTQAAPVSRARAQAPPGLAKPGTWEPEGSGHRNLASCTGPRQLLRMLQALQQSGELTPAMLISLAVAGLPAVTQRVARKVDKINHTAKHGLSSSTQRFLEALAHNAHNVPGLEWITEPLQKLLHQEPGPQHLGETLLSFLKAAGFLAFDAKVRLVESVAENLLPLLEEIGPEVGIGREDPEAGRFSLTLEHPGVICDGCGMDPLRGPRFRCGICPDYDLCGNCYPRKQELHGDCGGATHTFECLLRGKGKGKGKGECKATFRAAVAASKGWPWKPWGPYAWAEGIAATEGKQGQGQAQGAVG